MVGNVKYLLGVSVFGMGAVFEHKFFLHLRSSLFAACQTAEFGGSEWLWSMKGCGNEHGLVMEFLSGISYS